MKYTPEGNESNAISEAILHVADAIDDHSKRILEVRDSIDVHAKSIDGLSQNIHWSFRDSFDENVADMLGKVNNQFVMFNKLIEEAGRLLNIANIGQYLKRKS